MKTNHRVLSGLEAGRFELIESLAFDRTRNTLCDQFYNTAYSQGKFPVSKLSSSWFPHLAPPKTNRQIRSATNVTKPDPNGLPLQLRRLCMEPRNIMIPNYMKIRKNSKITPA